MKPTVKIADPFNEGRFLIINESNFDPKKHTLFTETAQAPVVVETPKPKEGDLPEWPVKTMTPAEYWERYGEGRKHSELAKKHIEAETK